MSSDKIMQPLPTKKSEKIMHYLPTYLPTYLSDSSNYSESSDRRDSSDSSE